MCFDNKVNKLLYTIRNIGRLPNVGEFFFEDKTDQREFYDELKRKCIDENDLLEDDIKRLTAYQLIKNVLSEYKVSDEESEIKVELFRKRLEDIKKQEADQREASRFIKLMILEEIRAEEEEKLKKEQLKLEKKRLRQEAKRKKKEDKLLEEIKDNSLNILEKKSLEIVKLYLTDDGKVLDKEQLIDTLCKMWYPEDYKKEKGIQKVIK